MQKKKKGSDSFVTDLICNDRNSLSFLSFRSNQVLENIRKLSEKRYSPEERDSLLQFYDDLLENIASEMQNCGCGKNVPDAHVQHLLEELQKELEDHCECEMSLRERRVHMLQLLCKRTEEKKKAVSETDDVSCSK